jgi:hypothetical protein
LWNQHPAIFLVCLMWFWYTLTIKNCTNHVFDVSIVLYLYCYILFFLAVRQGSSTFQTVRATLTISMMPAGHKTLTYCTCTHNWESGRSVNLTTNRYIMWRQRAGLAFVVIFSKQPAGHGKGLRGPRVEDPCCKGSVGWK